MDNLNYQLRDQWNAMMEARQQGDASSAARLMVQTAKVLLEEAAGLSVVPALPDQAGKRLLAQWSQTAKTLSGHLGPVCIRLDRSLEAFKTETAGLVARAEELSRQLDSQRVDYERIRPQHEAMQAREVELRGQHAALEPLFVHYRELADLDAKLVPALKDLGEKQEAFTALWPVLAEAAGHLQAERALLEAHFAADAAVAAALNEEGSLLALPASPAVERAVVAVEELRKTLSRLDGQLREARRDRQTELDGMKAR